MSLQLLFDALALGGIYAIAALGIALIFGVMRLVNFAHGQFIACAVFALIVPSTDALAVLGLGALPAPVLVPLITAASFAPVIVTVITWLVPSAVTTVIESV